MTTDQHIKKLAKFLEYVLARRPDEFGLIPDPDGFVKIKTLLQALHEDPEWRHLREAHLNTLHVTERTAPIEIQGDKVRAIAKSAIARHHALPFNGPRCFILRSANGPIPLFTRKD